MLVELLIILTITYAGNILKELLNIPMPGVIVGMGILFVLLKSGILKLEKIEKTADFILGNMLILFLPAMVKVIDYIDILKDDFIKILI
ncbi:MAG: CidA/LrgA family protein, partial [Fusobacteriaceae bacterium]